MTDPTYSPPPRNIEFNGKAGEYFGIWIVNILLSIITIGIYSAWAKVRNKKYFYQHTFIEGRNFDYHASGLQILLGRLIVVAAFVVFTFLSAIPIVSLILILLYLVFLPTLINRSLRFNARNTSWSNVRFDFIASYAEAIKALVGMPLLAAITLYTTFPFADRAMKRYYVNNHKFGKSAFRFDSGIGGFYRAFGAAILTFLLTVVLLALLYLVLVSAGILPSMQQLGMMLQSMQDPSAPPPPGVIIFFVLSYVGLLFMMLPPYMVYRALSYNLMCNNTRLEGHRLSADLPAGKLVGLVVTNIIAIVCTLGLMIPWTKIRMLRFYAQHTYVHVNGSLDDFVDQHASAPGAAGDAFTDIEGIDLGIGV